jgi:fucose permease
MAAGSLGNLCSIFLAGRMVGKIGPRPILGLGFLLDTASLGLFAASPSPLPNILLYLALGFGQGCLEVGVNWSVLRMDETGSARAMSLMHGAFSIGAVVGPFIMGILLAASLPWTTVYRGMALLLGFLMIVVMALPLDRLKGPAAEAKGKEIRQGGLVRWLGLMAMLFYVGTELGISNWAAEYFVKSFGYAPAAASFAVSMFWGGLTLGRFGFPILFRRTRPGRLILGLSILLAISAAALAALGLAGPAGSILAALAVGLAGLGASCIYPSAITLIGTSYRDDPGPAIGMASAGGAVGAFGFPFLMSAIASAWSVQAGFSFYAGLAVLSLLSCTALAAAAGRRASG